MDAKKFPEHAHKVYSAMQGTELTNGQLAVIAKYALTFISVQIPDHIWGFFDELTEKEGIDL